MKEVEYSVAMFNNTPLPFCVIRVELDDTAAPVDWTFLYCNDALAELEGYPKEMLLGKRFFKLFPNGDRKWLKPYYEAAYEKKASAFDSVSEEIGQYLHIDCIPLDEPGLCACLLRNIKQESEYRQRLEREISAANDLHTAITTGTWRIEYDAAGERTICLWSDSFRKLLNFDSSEDFPNEWDSWFNCIHPDDRKIAFDEYERAALDRSGKRGYDVEYRMRNREGEYHWFRDVAHFTRNPDGLPQCADGIVSLIDDKHRLDEELHAALHETERMNRALQSKTEFLRRTERYNRTLLDRASCGITSYTLPERENLYMNAEALRVYGIGSLADAQKHRDEIMKQSVFSNPVALRKLKALRTQDGAVDYECNIISPKGHSASVIAHTEVVTSPQGERVAYTTFMDASENKSLQNEKEILNALCKDYATVLQCDLQSDSVIRLNINPGQASPRAEEVYRLLEEDSSYRTTLATYFDVFIDPEFSADFFQMTDPDYLMDYLPKHNNRFSYRYQLKPNPFGVKHMEMQISHFNSAEGFQVVVGFRVIDDIIREEERKKERLQAINATLRERNDIITGLAKDYTNVWLVTDNGNCCGRYQGGDLDHAATESAEFAERIHSYTKAIQYYCSKLVIASAQQEFLQKTEYKEVLHQMQKQPVYAVTYPRRYDDREEYYQVCFARTDSAESNDFIVAFKNVDEVVQAERKKNEALSTALAVAEHANRAKTQFLNNMSHDIRTPMNAIIGFTSLAGAHLDNKVLVQEYLRKISTSSEHLLSLINDVLDMSRIESGKVKIEEKSFHLPDLLHDIRTIIQPTIASKQLDFLIDTVDVVDEDVIADKLRLTQVLLNILGNGVKFNRTGGMISLRIRQESKAPTGYACYHFIIRDTGIGISKEFLEHIFESFARAESSTVSGIQGTGLGLAITKRIVDMMGGSISVKSEEGVGSEFDVCLTFKLSGEKKVYERIQSLQGLRVLVADDDTDTCLNVSKMLREIGMRPEWTVSGKEAVIRAKNAMDLGDEFYAYIIDWLMPDMNGIETVRRIRRVIGNSRPIIILTAYDWSDVEEEAREAGVTAFCEKPLFMSELRDILTNPYQVRPSKDEKKETKHFCGKKILLVEDNELNQEIAVTLLSEAGFITEVAENGSAAVEKMEKSAPDQYDLILMDVQMPVMDGYTATRKIRALQLPHCHTIPIIAMTANAFVEDQDKAIEAGMNGYHAKPIQISELLKTIKNVL